MTEFDKNFVQYDKKVKEETKNLALYFIVHITLYVFLVFFLIFFAWYTYFVVTHKFYSVEGISMKGALNPSVTTTDGKEDAVYVDKNGQLLLNDIIVIKVDDEDGGKKDVIKRLLAFGGDYVSIARQQDGTFGLFRIAKTQTLTEDFDESDALVDETSGVNGYQVYNPSAWALDSSQTLSPDGTDDKEWAYEKKFYDTFLAGYGDNNYRFDTFVSKNGLIFVKVPESQIFYMGDNRSSSKDARVRGFCDRKDVVGRAEIIVHDYNFASRLWEVVKYYFSQIEEFFAR